MHNFLVSAYKSQDFAQSQEIFARSHDRETVTFRNSARRFSPIDSRPFQMQLHQKAKFPHLAKSL